MNHLCPIRSASCSCSCSRILAWSGNVRRYFGLGQMGLLSPPRAGKNFQARRRARARLRGRNVAGYLLLEVLLALVILSIIVGLVFRIIQTTSQVTSNVQFLQGQQEHSDGIYEILRKDIESLPGTAEFETKRTRDEFQLIFNETSFNFSWKGAESGFGTVILAVRNQPDGRFSLVATEVPEPPVSDPDSKPPPPTVTTLITGLVRCDWRFFDRNTGKWVTNWTGGDRPSLFECTFQVSGEPTPVRAVFPWRVAQTLPANT
jgi:type II secretory pathway pseudopilin PulG